MDPNMVEACAARAYADLALLDDADFYGVLARVEEIRKSRRAWASRPAPTGYVTQTGIPIRSVQPVSLSVVPKKEAAGDHSNPPAA